MHHVQVPGDMGRVLGRGPAGLLFGAGDEDGDTLVWVRPRSIPNEGQRNQILLSVENTELPNLLCTKPMIVLSEYKSELGGVLWEISFGK